MKRAAVLFSGGKDSSLALYKVLKDNRFDVEYLLSIIPENPDSYMFHKPNSELLEKQAEMLGIDLVFSGSKGQKEIELDDLEDLIESVASKIDIVIVGGIASSYQATRVKKICEELGVEFCAPLWNYDAEKVWKELLDEGFKVVLTKMSCEGLDSKMLGRVIDNKMLCDLQKRSKKFGFRLDFEGGEAETAVLWMPSFTNEIRIKSDIKKQGPYNAFLNIQLAKE